ncbi:MAG: YggT family protein [Oligoflexales bacterium]
MYSALISTLHFATSMILNLLQIMVFAAVLVSWIGGNHYHPAVQKLRAFTDPLFAPFQKLGLQFGGMDLAPLFVLMIIHFLQRFIPTLLASLL